MRSGRLRVIVIGSVLSCTALVSQAQTPATVTLSLSVAGRTPSQIGYNLGHFYPGSNTATWWAYSGVNAARMWSNPSIVEPSSQDDLAPWGDGVTDLAGFNARRAALRADPLNPAYVNWSYFANNYANKLVTGNNMYLGYAFQTLTSLGVRFVVCMPRSEDSYAWRDPSTPEGWADRWEHWQHHYAQAFYLARYYSVHRFQMFNEPDHSSHPDLSQAQYLQQLQFSSDAFQAAVEDVNRLFDKSLVAEVQAPVTAGGDTKFHPNAGGDPRDDTTGWGELVVGNRHIDYAGNLVPSFNLIHTYAAQVYNLTGTGFANELAAIKGSIAAEPNGKNIKTAFTEFNVHTAATFETMPETLDSPSKFTRLGSILSSLANNKPDELYVFKFSQTAYDTPSGVKKNGVHYVSNDTVPYNVGGVTKGGAAVRLFARAFASDKPLLVKPTASGSASGDLYMAACREEDASRYYLLCTNTGTKDVDLSINLAPWFIPAGAKVTIEEVSERFHGEIAGLLDVPQNRVIQFRQRATSVLSFTISTEPVEEVTRTATADATVQAGANAAINYGSSAELLVKSHSTNTSARAASLIRFDLGLIDPAALKQAILTINARNPAGQGVVIAHVYGVSDESWQEASVTWNSAPNLGEARGADGLGAIDRIADNYVEGAGQTATLVGHLCADSTPADLMLDVTPFARAGSRYRTFLVVREVRFDGDVDDVNYIRFASREEGQSPPPRLLLRLATSAPIKPDFDRDADVDLDDFGHLQTCLAPLLEAIPPECLDADLNGDGFNTAADVGVFINCFGGASVPPNAACSSQ